MKKTRLMLAAEAKVGKPLEQALPEMFNARGLTETAAALGTSPSSVGYWLAKLQIPVRRVAVPPGTRGAGRLHIFNVAGERVRTMELGELSGGQFYYQGWDGRNDAGRDSASGVYIGQVKVGGNSAFFKMALIK